MQGKRFAVGALAGLLLGLVVVFSFSFAPSSFTYSSADLGTQKAAVTSATTTASSSSTYPTGGGAAYSTNSSKTNLPSSVSTSTTTAQSTSSTPSPALAFGANLSGSHSDRISSLSSIAAQPVVLDVLVILPIVFALVLGLLLKGASSRRIEKD